MSAPVANEVRRCLTCGGSIRYYEYTVWNGIEYDTLDAWWSHFEHPADHHDADPGATS